MAVQTRFNIHIISTRRCIWRLYRGEQLVARSPKGILYVGTQGPGKVYALVDRNGDGRADEVHTVASGLNRSIPLVGPGFSADEDLIKAVGEPMVGMYNTSHWAHDPSCAYGPASVHSIFPARKPAALARFAQWSSPSRYFAMLPPSGWSDAYGVIC